MKFGDSNCRETPSSLFFDTQDITGLSLEEWGLDSQDVLSNSFSIFPSRKLNTYKSKIVRAGYPKQMPLHYVILIPFFVRAVEPNLHFDKLIIPVPSSSTSYTKVPK
jgi:hypothetical protein